MIKIENINKYFNKHKSNELHVINNISLELEDNGLVALLGPSGSGKTTVLNVIGGLDNVKSGKIYINNEKITSRTANRIDKIRNLNIGYIFQDYKLMENMTVFENIAIVLKMIGIKDAKEIKQRVEVVLNKVGMYRYKNRPAGMLSGGEKQRVAIARAIVKSPNVILADEPTGNLDSQNSLEVMNLIKAISKEKLVILVTHEKNLATFFSDRIIEIEDGKIKKDYLNKHEKELDYQIENNFYLKDFKNNQIVTQDNIEINVFSEEEQKIKLDIVFKNGNIYIQNKNDERIEIVDTNSNIKFVNESYKKINKEQTEKYKFEFEDIKNKKYTSIYGLFSSIRDGFKGILKFSKLKKILLLGFLVAAIFTSYAVTTIRATFNIKDKDFVEYNNNYLIAKQGNVLVENYLEYEKLEEVYYVLPGDSRIKLNIICNDYWQTKDSFVSIQGSLASINLINSEDIVYGRMPQNEYELILDKMTLKESLEYQAKNLGIFGEVDFLDRTINLNDYSSFKIVGIVDKENPSIYSYNEQFINIISNAKKAEDAEYFMGMYIETENNSMQEDSVSLLDYSIIKDKIKIEKGRLPENDYETIVDISRQYEYKLNKQIDVKVNNKKLKVVGYFSSKETIDHYLVNNNTVKYNEIANKKGFIVCYKDKEKAINYFKELGINILDSYEVAKQEYLLKIKDSMKSQLIASTVILTISLIEVYLIMRSSFLSRIREIGILRAIGIKKKDIYRIFIGEIFAITTLFSVSGILIISYILKRLQAITYLESAYKVDFITVSISIIIVYVFNLLIGLIPVYRTIRKTPSQILSRQDI